MVEIKVQKTASRGIAIASAYIYREVDLTPDQYSVAEDEIEQEEARFQEVKRAVLTELEQLAQENPIFAAHMGIADDYTLQEGIVTRIQSGKKNVQQAFWKQWRKWRPSLSRWKMSICENVRQMFWISANDF